MLEISDKQAEMLAFIENFAAKHGYPPTHEEIRAGLNISSKSLVNYHLGALENARLLNRVPNTPRGIQLNLKQNAAQLPLVNTKPADTSPAMLSPADVLELTCNCTSDRSNLFAIKINGNAVKDGFVSEGDIVILQRPDQLKNGELVALRLPAHSQTSFKRYYRENGHVRLQSASAAQNETIVKPADVNIQGKVVAVIRQVE